MTEGLYWEYSTSTSTVWAWHMSYETLSIFRTGASMPPNPTVPTADVAADVDVGPVPTAPAAAPAVDGAEGAGAGPAPAPGEPMANWEKWWAWTTTSHVVELPAVGCDEMTVTVLVVHDPVEGS